MFSENTKKNWEKFGRKNPYYGVNTSKEFKGTSLSCETENVFFDSGREIIHRVLHLTGELYGRSQFDTAVDFGVGVGRLLIPLSKSCKKIWGVDISDSMLRTAKENCRKHSVNNAHFANYVEELPDDLDLVHSFVVIQHIPISLGMTIIETLMKKVRPGGLVAVHVPIRDPRPFPIRAAAKIQKNFFPARYVFNILRGNKIGDPVMQMNIYDLNCIAEMLFLYSKNVQLCPAPSSWPGTYIMAQRRDAA